MRVCSCACTRIDPVAKSSSFGRKLHAGATAGRSCRRRRSSRLHPSRIYLHSGHVALLPGVKVQPPRPRFLLPPLHEKTNCVMEKNRFFWALRAKHVFMWTRFTWNSCFSCLKSTALRKSQSSNPAVNCYQTLFSTASQQTWRCSGHISDKRQIGLYMEDAVQNLNEN